LASPTGYYNQLINAGNIQNQGAELVVNVNPVKTSKVSWDVSFNLGMNRNKVVELDDIIKQAPLGYGYPATPVVTEGKSFGDLVTYRWKRDMFGRYVVTEKGMPLWTSAPESVGNYYPKATLGLTNTIQYNRLSLRLLLDGRVGGVMVSGTEIQLASLGIAEVTAEFREGGLLLGGITNDGKRAKEDLTAEQFWHSLIYIGDGVGEFFAYDITNFRVREVTLSCNVPIPPGLLIKQARISAVARNLFFLYRGSSILDIPGIGKRKMAFDPDMSLNNTNFQGVEHFTVPSARSIGFNVQLVF
jgi:hypothetical protein